LIPSNNAGFRQTDAGFRQTDAGSSTLTSILIIDYCEKNRRRETGDGRQKKEGISNIEQGILNDEGQRADIRRTGYQDVAP